MKAMIVNRIGDIGIAIAMFITYDTFKTLDFEAIFAASSYISENSNTLTIINYEFDRLTLIGVFFLVGAAGKSAQMGLHT
jgi:NADH:ubiquinone oxidoreductase subunit 5 (subunit L)/multisubunit Na+/H+ antiporter MnhA subunit